MASGKKTSINVPIFFVCGGPGSGKGTQCAKLVTKYGLCHLSSGDLLRAEVASGTTRGADLQRLMTAGELVPLDTVLALIRDAMEKALKTGAKGFLIDGYPRELKQGEQFEASIGAPALVVYFDVSDPVLTARLLERGKSSGRADDNAETIKKRLGTFHNQTAPVITHYGGKGKLLKVDATGTVDAVFAQITPSFDKHLKR